MVLSYPWKLKIPLKIKVFIWLLYIEAILTKDNLQQQPSLFDEDIPDNVPYHGPAEPSQTPNTPIQGPIRRSRANKLQQEVNSLTKIDYNTNENFILPKFSTYVLLRFTHMGATAGPKETSYEEAEPSQ
jgi:hypothetical protein